MPLAHSSQGQSQTEAMLNVSFVQVVKKKINCPVTLQKKEWTLANTPSQDEKCSKSVKIVTVHSRANQASSCCASQLCAEQVAQLLAVGNQTFSGPESGTSFNRGDNQAQPSWGG